MSHEFLPKQQLSFIATQTREYDAISPSRFADICTAFIGEGEKRKEITVCIGNILFPPAYMEAIVCPFFGNADVIMNSIGERIFISAGSEPFQELKKQMGGIIRRRSQGEVFITDSGELKMRGTKQLMYVVAGSPYMREKLSIIRSITKSVLIAAKKENIHTIALPLFGGKACVTKESFAISTAISLKGMVDTISTFLLNNPDTPTTSIRIIDSFDTYSSDEVRCMLCAMG